MNGCEIIQRIQLWLTSLPHFSGWIIMCHEDESSSVSVLDIGKLKDKEIREQVSSLISAKLGDNWQQLEVGDIWELMKNCVE